MNNVIDKRQLRHVHSSITDVHIIEILTRSCAIAEGRHDVLVNTNLATMNHPIKD